MSAKTVKSEIILQGTSYLNFINAVKSPATRKGYNNALKRYLNHLKLKIPDDLLLDQVHPKLIETQLIDYIMSLRNEGLAHSTIAFNLAPILTFYQLNDVLLNRMKISKYLGEYHKVTKDKPYSVEQIQKMLEVADSRMRMIILLLVSTGCRIGALPALTLGSLTKLPEYGMCKIVFYEHTRNEYISFTTREATSNIENYIQYRIRSGEHISFNEDTQKWEPEDSPLIRKQFDMNDVLQARNPQPMKLDGLRAALSYHLIKSGIREYEHTTEDVKNRIRKPVSFANEFRKRAISIFIEAGLNHEIRELLVDHATGLDANYFRPTEDQLLNEYLKAEPYLTIDDSLRVKQENQILRINKDKLESRLDKLEEMYRSLI